MDTTDTILGGCAAAGMALCGICVLVHAWRNSGYIVRRQMKQSRSDTDLTSILDNAIPSASAGRTNEATPDTP